jgi:broad specificity phosphatase PhoE
MRTVLYLLRHGATEANVARPPRLQGRRQNLPLAEVGVRQAELTRDFLAVRAIDQVYTSPLVRAAQTAEIIAAPHRLRLQVRDELTECDIGRWENLDWQTIRAQDPDSYHKFMANPASFGYPGGESLAEVHERGARVLAELIQSHAGETLLVVSHHVVNRTYLAVLLGLKVEQARRVRLDNCGISIVEHDGGDTIVTTLNAAFHLQGVEM